MFVRIKYKNSWSWADQFSTSKTNLHQRYPSPKCPRGNMGDSGVVRKKLKFIEVSEKAITLC